MESSDGTSEQPLDAVSEAQEQVYLAYIKRWTNTGRRVRPLTRDQVLKLIADYPNQDDSGKIAIASLLEIYVD